MQYPKRLTVKTVGFNPRQMEAIAEAHPTKPTSILRVWGSVSNKKSGSTPLGNYFKFMGEFAGLNLVTSEEYRSSQLLLPAVAETVVNALFDRAAKDGSSAQIALEITVEYIKPRTEGSTFTKFMYGVKPLIEYKGEDILSVMAKEFPAPVMVKQLEGPKGARK